MKQKLLTVLQIQPIPTLLISKTRFVISFPGKSVDDTEYAAIGGGLYNTYSYADHSFNSSKKLFDAPISPEATEETYDYMKPTAALRYTDYEELAPHNAGLESESNYERPVSYVEVLESDS